MTPYYEHGGVTIYHGDARELLPTLGTFDLVLTDPPYGIGALWQGGSSAGWRKAHDDVDRLDWDATPPDAALLAMTIAAGRDAVIWGGNYFPLPPRRGWLVWDKLVRKFNTGHCELAWSTLDQPIRAFNYSHGQLATEGKDHPTQKPLPLIAWCLGFFPDAQTVVDPFMGSGTTLRAAKDAGKRAVGIDRVERYCEIAARRLAQEVLFA